MKRRWWAILGLLIFAIIMLHLYISSHIIDLSYKTTEMKVELDKLQSENRKLRATLAQRRTFAILEKKAQELGFGSPEKIYFLILPTKESDTR